MKRLITILAIASLILAGCTGKKTEKDEATSAENSQEVAVQEDLAPKVNPEEAKSLITKFYTEVYDNNMSIDKWAEFLGDKLNAKLNEMDGEIPLFNYDPFINAQDYDANYIQSSLVITELSDDLYQVDVEPMKGYKQTLQLTVGFDDGGVLKILDIPSNPDVSVLK